MATVDKNFRVKNGLIVEGTTAKVNDKDVLLDGDSTDLLVEGETNLFYTDDRVKDVLTGATQENISITVEEGVLTIAAENGVDDSTTDDLDEGTTNLYFTDQRAIDATASEYDPIGSAATAESNANSYTDGAIGALDTDDIPEGDTNLYYTDARARSSISGGTGISYDSESGVVDVDTAEIATRQYVDSVSEGLHIHASVAVATEENIDLASPPSTIDGVTLVEGMRVLVKDQTNAAQNGIYVFEDGSLVRAEDHDTASEVQAGDFVFVEGGTTYGATGWVQLNSVSTLGTDPIEWTQFLGAGTFGGGTGIDVDGQEISIDFTEFDTDNIDEGETNLYYTDQRVEDVIANSDTDDLSEGATNLYFTDQRAVDALEAVTPNFTEVEINSVSKQVAAILNVPDAQAPTIVYSFDGAIYRSAKFIVKAASGSHTEVSEILLTLDSSNNVSITEYAIVSTNGNLIDVTATESTGNVRIIVEAVNANTTVTVFGTLIA
jgi:hypothetical protein